ncbi:MAG: alpha/beta hydrolase [Planctomycetes bacterium]|nr:alpha/beta hydrolase [Planctomycetota bacterium]
MVTFWATLLRFLLYCFIIYLALALFLTYSQGSLLYHPTQESNHGHKVEVLNNDGEKLNLIVLNEGQDDALIYFGGNAEAVEDNAYIFSQSFPNHSIYLLNYRAFGGSSGSPSESGNFSDALALYELVSGRHASIDVLGRSLGSGVAVFLASEREVRHLALVTPYDSIESVAQGRYFMFPIFLMLKDKYKSIDRVPHLKQKTLILRAETDQVVPAVHTDNLLKAFKKDSVNVKLIPGSNHNTINNDQKYHKYLREHFGYE